MSATLKLKRMRSDVYTPPLAWPAFIQIRSCVLRTDTKGPNVHARTSCLPTFNPTRFVKGREQRATKTNTAHSHSKWTLIVWEEFEFATQKEHTKRISSDVTNAVCDLVDCVCVYARVCVVDS